MLSNYLVITSKRQGQRAVVELREKWNYVVSGTIDRHHCWICRSRKKRKRSCEGEAENSNKKRLQESIDHIVKLSREFEQKEGASKR